MPTVIEQTQKDVLANDLSKNPLLTASPLASKDNALKTTSKRIIGAINEVFQNIKTIGDTSKAVADATELRVNEIDKKVDNTVNMVGSVVNESSESLKKVNESLTTIDNITKDIANNATTNDLIANELTSINNNVINVLNAVNKLPSGGPSGGSSNGPQTKFTSIKVSAKNSTGTSYDCGYQGVQWTQSFDMPQDFNFIVGYKIFMSNQPLNRPIDDKLDNDYDCSYFLVENSESALKNNKMGLSFNTRAKKINFGSSFWNLFANKNSFTNKYDFLIVIEYV